MKKVFLILLVALIMATFIIEHISWSQEEKEGAIAPETAGIILKQLKEISQNQQEILNEMAQIKEDLKIIKMRTTLK